jgi:hypothetical protein
VPDRAPGVTARVDARHDDVGRIAERTEPARANAQTRGTVDRVCGNSFTARHLDLLHVEMLVGVHETDRGSDAAAIAVGCDDHDLVLRAVEGGGEDVQTR